MPNKLKELVEQRMRAVEEMRKIADRAAAGEKLSGEDEAAYVKANKDIDDLGKKVSEERKLVAAENENAEAMAIAAAKRGEAGSAERRDGNAERVSELRSQFQEALKREGYDGGRVPEGMRGGFSQMMPDKRFLTTPEGRAALVTNVATRGPEVLDETLVQNLYVALFEQAEILSAGVTVLRTETGNPIKFPKLASRGRLSQANARRTETQTINKGEPTLDQIELGSFGYKQISQASSEVVRDAVVDIEGLLGSNLGTLIADYFAYDLVLGTGASQPRGVATIVNAGSNKVTRTTTPSGSAVHVPTFDDLLDVMWKLNRSDRPNGKWLLNDMSVLPLRKIKDADGNYLWAPGDATTPDTLHNRPTVIEPYMPAYGEDTLPIIYGNFAKYYVRIVGQTRIDWSTEYAFDTDMVSVRGIVHGDGDAVDDSAFAGFVSSLAA